MITVTDQDVFHQQAALNANAGGTAEVILRPDVGWRFIFLLSDRRRKYYERTNGTDQAGSDQRT